MRFIWTIFFSCVCVCEYLRYQHVYTYFIYMYKARLDIFIISYKYLLIAAEKNIGTNSAWIRKRHPYKNHFFFNVINKFDYALYAYKNLLL